MGVKKFIKKSVAFVAAAAMALTMVVAPVGAGAGVSYAEGTGSTTTDPNPNLILDKTAKLQSDGTYKITLEAYAKGSVNVTEITSGKPCDIVLVLDQSGSMAYKFDGNKLGYWDDETQSRQYALKEAAKNFINKVSENAMKDSNNLVDHKIALVTFGESSSIISGKKSAGSAFVSVKNTTGRDSLLRNITDLPTPNGATAIDEGMSTAKSIMDNNPIGNQNRKRIVVVFTDGYPTSSSNFDVSVANSAISTGKTLKDNQTTIYTIGIFNGAKVDELYGGSDENASWTTDSLKAGSENTDPAANRFLNYLSSNFNASSLGLSLTENNSGYPGYPGYPGGPSGYTFKVTANFDREFDKYYMTADSKEELNNIFETISKDVISGGTSVNLDKTAVARDIISDNFDLPKGYSKSKVIVKTAAYKGNGYWENPEVLSDANVTINGKTIDVSNFDYKTNYVAEATEKTNARGQKLIIEITDVVANKAGMNLDTNTAESGIYSNNEFIKAFPQPKVDIDSTSYVLDYGKTVTTAASDYGVSAVTKANTGKPSPYNIKLTGQYGTFAINGNDLNYKPGKINWDGIDTGYVFGQKSSSEEYKWEEVNFMPASSVYYEDDFRADDNTDSNVAIVWTGSWGKGTSNGGQQSAANSDYGWDDSYVNDTGFSNGSAHYSSQNLATATFRFTGTGVDVYSRTNSGVGKISTSLKKVTKNTDGTETVKTIRYKSIDNLSVTGDYYQIPTLNYDGLDYGTYEVTIKVITVSAENRGTYYLDGIRVYNPLKGNQTAEEAYDKANEANANYITVRSGLIDTTNTSVIHSQMEGSVFIDKVADSESGENTTTDIGTYEDYGPKNEVYLKNGQGVAFTIKGYNSTTDKVAVGLKSPTGSEVTVDVTAGAKKANPLKIKSASDLYYEVTPTSDGKVVIKNTNGALLSVTKVKITSKNTATNSAPSEKSLVVTPQLMSYVDTFDTLPVQEDTTDDNQGSTAGDSRDDMLDKDDVDIDNPSDNDKDNSNEDNNSEQNKPNNIWNQIISSIKGWFRK